MLLKGGGSPFDGKSCHSPPKFFGQQLAKAPLSKRIQWSASRVVDTTKWLASQGAWKVVFNSMPSWSTENKVHEPFFHESDNRLHHKFILTMKLWNRHTKVNDAGVHVIMCIHAMGWQRKWRTWWDRTHRHGCKKCNVKHGRVLAEGFLQVKIFEGCEVLWRKWWLQSLNSSCSRGTSRNLLQKCLGARSCRQFLRVPK